MNLGLKLACFVLILAILASCIRPLLFSILKMSLAPLDETVGSIATLDEEELAVHFANKKVLLIGGTRGVGLGTAIVMARSGAKVTIVGRNERSGLASIERIRADLDNKDNVQFVQGDIGSVCDTKALVERLVKNVSNNNLYDYLVVSAATFPNWKSPLQNDDGIDKSFAIAVVGRFIIYRNMHRFLKIPSGRMLNVLAAGTKMNFSFDRDLAIGNKNVTSLFQGMMSFAVGNDLMLLVLGQNDPNVKKITRVSTHPGHLETDLHRGQGFLFDVVEKIMVLTIGISIETSGLQQASIIVSDRLKTGELSYVDFFGLGRKMSPQLEIEFNEHAEWLWAFLTDLEENTYCA